MADNQHPETGASRQRNWYERAALMFAASVFVGAATGGVMALNSRFGAEVTPGVRPPLVVNTGRVIPQMAYSVSERFVGIIEPARQTRLSFERPGLVTEIVFDEGDTVSEGDVVARLDVSRAKSERRGLEARLQELEAQHSLASVTLSRQGTLKSRGWQSEQKFDEARFKVAELASAIRGVKASIDAIDIDISKSELKATYSGTVAARSIDEGSVVNAGAPVIEIVEAGVRRIRVGLSVAAANAIEPGRSYRLVSNGREFEGRLAAKRPDLQAGTRTVTVLFEVGGADELPLGEIVEVIVERSVKADGAWVPISALSEGAKGLWTLLSVVDGEGGPVIAREAVEVLHVENGKAYVRGNLSTISRIVVNGTNRIIPGQRVALASQTAGRE